MTGRSTTEFMVRGFCAGCDDYITKPFSMRVLLMKIAAVLKRSGGVSRQICACGGFVYDFENKTLMRHGERVELTALEDRLLELFYATEESC